MQMQELFEAFNGKRVLVIGDVMTDAYMHGHVSRMSPEAPVPVVDLLTEEQRIGGAGNVALNLIALGAEAHLSSVIGHDSAGQKLQAMLQAAGIQVGSIDRPGDSGNHGKGLAIDVPASQVPVGKEKELSRRVRQVLGIS